MIKSKMFDFRIKDYVCSASEWITNPKKYLKYNTNIFAWPPFTTTIFLATSKSNTHVYVLTTDRHRHTHIDKHAHIRLNPRAVTAEASVVPFTPSFGWCWWHVIGDGIAPIMMYTMRCDTRDVLPSMPTRITCLRLYVRVHLSVCVYVCVCV